MKRRILLLVVAAIAALTVTGVALAAVTFHSGPTFTTIDGSNNGYTANLSADASGLGQSSITGSIAFSGTVQYTCQNNGGNIAPGQPFVFAQPPATQTVAPDKNGRAIIDLTVSFSAPPTQPGKDVGCPSGKWTGINPVIIGPVTATAEITFKGQTLYGPVTQTVDS
jgi:hypothetical protein